MYLGTDYCSGMMETRVDMFLFRAGFFETLSSSYMCFYGKAYYEAKIRVFPWNAFNAFELCSVRHYRFVRKESGIYFPRVN